MKIKQLNRKKRIKYSCVSAKSNKIFNNRGFGLDFAWKVYEEKNKNQYPGNLKFESFLEAYYNPEIIYYEETGKPDYPGSALPHYVPVPIKIFPSYSSANINKEFYFNPSEQFHKSLSENFLEIKESLLIITGDSGMGKTTSQLLLAQETKNYESPIALSGYIACELDISKGTDDIGERIKYSLGLKLSSTDIKIYLKYSSPLLFLLDLNSVTDSIRMDNQVKISQLIDILKEIVDLFDDLNFLNNTSHRIVLSYRGTVRSLNDTLDPLYLTLKQRGMVWEIQSPGKEAAKNYIEAVSGQKGLLLTGNISSKITTLDKQLISFTYNASDILKLPIFLDFINWLSHRTGKIKEIVSPGHLYLILTRELLRKECKGWQDKNLFGLINLSKYRNKVLMLDEKEFTESQDNYQSYTFENKPHHIDLFLQIIADRLGNTFSEEELNVIIEEIITDKKYLWLKDYRELENTLSKEQKISEDNLRKYTLLKSRAGGRIEFFHASICNFYKARSFFYNPYEGIFVPFKDKTYYENKINNCDNPVVLQYFINLLNLNAYKIVESGSIKDFLLSLNLTANGYFFCGKALSFAGMLDEAIIYYEMSFKLKPDHYKAINNLGTLYAKKGRYKESLKKYHQALEINPHFPEALFNLAMEDLENEDFQGEMEKLKKALEINPDLEYAQTYFGDSYARINDIQNAIVHWKKAIEVNPNIAEPYKRLGNYYLKINRVDDAIRHFEEIIRIDPSIPDGYYELATIYYKLAQNELAYKMYKKGNSYNNNLKNEFLDYIQIVHYNYFSDELKNYLKYLSQSDFTSCEVLHHLGLICFHNQTWEEAIQYFKSSLEINPDLQCSRLLLAESYLMIGEWENARNSLEVLLSFHPTDFIITYQIGTSYLHQEEYQDALEYYIKSSELNPELAHNYNDAGFCLLNLGEQEKAKAYFYKSIEKDPDLEIGYINLGLCCHINENYEEAIDFYNKALDINPYSFQAINNLGLIFFLSGDISSALEYFRKLNNLYPDDKTRESININNDLEKNDTKRLQGLFEELISDQRIPEAIRVLEKLLNLRHKGWKAKLRAFFS